MNQTELRHVIREITRVVIKEFLSSTEFSLNPSSPKNQPAAPTATPTDPSQMTPQQRSEMEQQKKADVEANLKDLEAEKKVMEKEKEFGFQNARNLQTKAIPNLNKQIQSIKTGGL